MVVYDGLMFVVLNEINRVFGDREFITKTVISVWFAIFLQQLNNNLEAILYNRVKVQLKFEKTQNYTCHKPLGTQSLQFTK